MENSWFTEDEISIIQNYVSAFETRICAKNEILINAGTYSSEIFFVQKGVLRSFYYSKEGEELTIWFASENEIISAINSIFLGRPTPYSIQCLEHETELKVFTYEDLNKSFVKSAEIYEIYVKFIKLSLLYSLNKLVEFQSLDSKQRYESFLQYHPRLIDRISHKHIASFLNMTRQNFSKIRNSYK
ncbi:MAG: Crp/Fnr family transcriptional regulator [Marinifilaceae bacterium]|jgi:CRP-like cAMP-binding protein|nr:Crp/Fnr family transcriptional regulator [Marinifilaceae bacterium]